MKAIVSSTICNNNRHTSDRCWFGAETKLHDTILKYMAERLKRKKEGSWVEEYAEGIYVLCHVDD